MIRFLIKVVLIAVIAIMGYNYFFGNEKERRQTENVIEHIKNAGSSMWDLLKGEKKRIEEGKYEEVMENIQNVIDKMKRAGNKASDEFSKVEEDLEKTRKDVQDLKGKSDSELKSSKDSIESELNSILERLQKLDSN